MMNKYFNKEEKSLNLMLLLFSLILTGIVFISSSTYKQISKVNSEASVEHKMEVNP